MEQEGIGLSRAPGKPDTANPSEQAGSHQLTGAATTGTATDTTNQNSSLQPSLPAAAAETLPQDLGLGLLGSGLEPLHRNAAGMGAGSLGLLSDQNDLLLKYDFPEFELDQHQDQLLQQDGLTEGQFMSEHELGTSEHVSKKPRVDS